jgi:MFS family permease
MTTASVAGRAVATTGSVETRYSWVVAVTALGILSVSFGAPTITVVALKPIAADLGGVRSVPALCYALTWLGSAAGGIAMGHIAERIGVRWTVIFGALMIAAGLLLSSLGKPIDLYLGHGLFMGLLGNSGINAPLYVYVSRWFDRRRGSALGLIASGQAVAGMVWAPVFGYTVEWIGWQHTMQLYAVFAAAVIAPAAFLVFHELPSAAAAGPAWREPRAGELVLGLKPRTVFTLLCAAGFLCCVAMAMPQSHLVAFCSDVGIPITHGAAMLSVLLACAFIGRQVWGFVADKIGGLRTILAGSVCQATAMTGFLMTQDEAGLYVVAVAFGLGFSGMIPAYAVAIRELFSAREASWRIPTFLLCSGMGMAAGGWLAGAIYDAVGFYAAAFAAGIAFGLGNTLIVALLVFRQSRLRSPLLAQA